MMGGRSRYDAPNRYGGFRPTRPERNWTARVLDFSRRAVIRGEAGFVMVETISKALKTCPLATVRILARWEGALAAGTEILVSGDRLEVLKHKPINGRQRVAHLLCRPCQDKPGRPGEPNAAES